MDSGNSGSLQSSSGGDEEYDSRAAAVATPTELISTFLNHGTNIANVNPSHPPFHSFIFDPLSNYYDPRPQPIHNPQLLNLDPLIWSESLQQPDPINPDLFSPQPNSRPRGGGQDTSLPSVPPPPVTADQNPREPAVPSATSAVRNPKKRSRASRRAPTTVLTTDTSNFRAMVQEFTGIPAPPFAATSQFPRSRLDLFGTHSSIRSNLANNNTSSFDNSTSDQFHPPPPPYLLRPLPQKLQPPPFLNSSSSSSTTSPSSILNAMTSAAFQGNSLNQAPPTTSFLAGLKTHASLEPPAASSNNNLITEYGDEYGFGLGGARGTTLILASTGGEDRGGGSYSSCHPKETASFHGGNGRGSRGREGEGMVDMLNF